MPNKLGNVYASLGSYTGEDGKKHRTMRDVGVLLQHSDGRAYLMLRADFDFGRIPVAPGRDAFFLEVQVETGKELILAPKEPG